MITENVEIIGFDLGHGESALALTRQRALTEPVPVEIDGSKTIITAVGIDAEGKTVVGREVLADADGLTESYTRFKDFQLDRHPNAGRATRLFVRAIADRLTGQRLLSDPATARFFVGCPSGWSPETQSEYRLLLEASGLKQCCVIPESRAAFLHARESRKLSEAELAGRVLLIDIGSSTTDFTYSEQLNARPMDVGHTTTGDIGAGQLDQLILDETIENQSDARSVREFLALNPGKMAEFDLKCRDAKHEYFMLYAGKGKDVSQLIRLYKGCIIEIVLNDRIMTRLLTEKKTPGLGGLSWIAAFERRLADVRDQRGAAPDFIIVTGGAARMGFVTDLVAKAFPNARVVRGEEPEFAIAKGLALFGRADLAAQSFLAEVKALAGGPDVKNIVSAAIPALHNAIAEKLSRAILREVMRKQMIAWRDGQIRTLRQMEERIMERVAGFAEEPDARKLISDVAKSWFEDLRPAIHQITDPICARHHKPASLLDIPPDTHFSTQSASDNNLDIVGFNGVGNLLAAIIAAIVGMISGGTGVALFHLPFIGQVIAGLLVFVALIVKKDDMMEAIKDWNILQPARYLLTDGVIDNKLTKAEADLTEALRSNMAKTDEEAEPGAKLAGRIAAQIDRALRQRADDAILRFG